MLTAITFSIVEKNIFGMVYFDIDLAMQVFQAHYFLYECESRYFSFFAAFIIGQESKTTRTFINTLPALYTFISASLHFSLKLLDDTSEYLIYAARYAAAPFLWSRNAAPPTFHFITSYDGRRRSAFRDIDAIEAATPWVRRWQYTRQLPRVLGIFAWQHLLLMWEISAQVFSPFQKYSYYSYDTARHNSIADYIYKWFALYSLLDFTTIPYRARRKYWAAYATSYQVTTLISRYDIETYFFCHHAQMSYRNGIQLPR